MQRSSKMHAILIAVVAAAGCAFASPLQLAAVDGNAVVPVATATTVVLPDTTTVRDLATPLITDAPSPTLAKRDAILSGCTITSLTGFTSTNAAGFTQSVIGGLYCDCISQGTINGPIDVMTAYDPKGNPTSLYCATTTAIITTFATGLGSRASAVPGDPLNPDVSTSLFLFLIARPH